MAKLNLSYEECAALRRAGEQIPVHQRSVHLLAALRVLSAVMAAVESGRRMLDEEDTPTPAG